MVLPAPTTSTLAVLLGDGRLPTGGHVHSAGLEQARADGRLTDLADLDRLLRRRLRTAGVVAAGVAAASCAAPQHHALLDVEVDARTPSPPQREASRAQGRGLLRLAAAAWPHVRPDLGWDALGRRPHHAVVLGCAARAGGLGPREAAVCAAYLSVSGPAGAAQRLMALDPVSVSALTVRHAEAVDALVDGLFAPGPDSLTDLLADLAAAHPEEGVRQALAGLPSDSDPVLDLLAGRHATAADRLFAS